LRGPEKVKVWGLGGDVQEQRGHKPTIAITAVDASVTAAAATTS
jgi:hypothetical protein